MDKKNKKKDILVTKGLKKHFGDVHAVDGVDLEISEGEVLSIVGPNGAGKTTFLNLLSGALKPDKGKITFDGKEITNLPIQERNRLGISLSFQIPAPFDGLKVLHNLIPGISEREKKSYGLLPIMRYSEIMDDAERRLDQFNLPKDSLAEELPHGARKILDCVIATTSDPKLILLDEPTSGVSTDEKFELMEMLKPVLKKMTTIMVEHDMEIVSEYSDRMSVMDRGKLIQKGVPEKVMNDPKVKEVMEV